MFRHRLAVLVVIALVVAIAIIGLRQRVIARLQEQVRGQYAERVAQLPPEQAVQLLRQLAIAPELYLPAIAASLGDTRPAVRAAARTELRAIVQRWSALPLQGRSARASELAAELSRHAPQMSLDSRATAQEIVHMLLQWPLDGRSIDVAQTIADCEQVLSLPCEEPAELRIADARSEPARLSTPQAASISDE